MSESKYSYSQIKLQRQGVDPAGVMDIQQDFMDELDPRFDYIKDRIEVRIAERNELGLPEDGVRVTLREDDNGFLDYDQSEIKIALQEGFQFTTDPGKVAAFDNWLNQLIEDEFALGISDGEIIDGDHFTADYIRRTGTHAIEQSNTELVGKNIIDSPDELSGGFNAPIRRDLLNELYTRTYENLDDITVAMSDEIRETLTEAMVDGVHPRSTSRLLNDRVEKIGRTRAHILAHTETMHAFSETTLNRFEEAGVDSVVGKVEMNHAGDNRVCDECIAIVRDEGRYSINEARGLIPVHPRCRCNWLIDTSTV